MPRSKFRARPGTRFSDKDAVIIGVELSKMAASGLSRSPRAIVEWARKSASPLHRYFDWDDESAAEKHRIEQARELVGAVMEISVSTGKPARAFHSVAPDDSVREYQPTRTVQADETWLQQVSDRMYLSIQASVREAESLGLEKEARWRKVIRAVNK